MHAHPNVLRREREQLGKHGNLYFYVVDFRHLQWSKARVMHDGADGALGHDLG